MSKTERKRNKVVKLEKILKTSIPRNEDVLLSKNRKKTEMRKQYVEKKKENIICKKYQEISLKIRKCPRGRKKEK